MKTIESLKSDILAKEQEIAELHKKLAPLQKTSTKLYNEKNRLIEQLDQLTIKSSKIKSSKTDWNYVLEENGNLSMERYKYAEQQLKNIGLIHSGYLPETQQRGIRLSLIKNDPNSLKTTLKGLNIILPYIKPMTKEFKGYKYISIFEHTLSEAGVYFLLIKDNDIRLNITSWHRTRELKKFTDLKTALEYIQENHYYELFEDKNENI